MSEGLRANTQASLLQEWAKFLYKIFKWASIGAGAICGIVLFAAIAFPILVGFVYWIAIPAMDWSVALASYIVTHPF